MNCFSKGTWQDRLKTVRLSSHVVFQIRHLSDRSTHNSEWMQTAQYLKAVHQSLRNTVPWFIYLPSSQNKLKINTSSLPTWWCLENSFLYLRHPLFLFYRCFLSPFHPKNSLKMQITISCHCMKLHTNIIGCCKERWHIVYKEKPQCSHPSKL